MVSSKCLYVESPSPLRFLAALMPPWAQTECERFTGTIENRSTSPPISAILMTAARPARPPPTTMIFGADILYESDLWLLVGSRSSLVVTNLPSRTINDRRPTTIFTLIASQYFLYPNLYSTAAAERLRIRSC